MQREPSGKIPVHWLVHLFKGFIEMGCPVTVYSLILLENEKIDIAKRRERRFSQLEDSIQSFQEIYAAAYKEGQHVDESKTELSEHSMADESLENEVESQQSDMEQCKETEEEQSNHPIQKLYSDESLLSE